MAPSNQSVSRKKPTVQTNLKATIISIDLPIVAKAVTKWRDDGHWLPYQWLLLKTYADEDPLLVERVRWKDPIQFSTTEAASALSNPSFFLKKYDVKNLDVVGLSCYC